MDKQEKLKIEIETIEVELDKIDLQRDKIIERFNKKEEELLKLHDKLKDKKNYQVWKVMEGKYYHILYYHLAEEKKFEECMYVHVIKVEKDCLEYEYIHLDPTYTYITLSKYDYCYERGYKEWTEITKYNYNKIIKQNQPLERVK